MGIAARYFYTAVYTSNIHHPLKGRLSVVGYIVSYAYSYLCLIVNSSRCSVSSHKLLLTCWRAARSHGKRVLRFEFSPAKIKKFCTTSK